MVIPEHAGTYYHATTNMMATIVLLTSVILLSCGLAGVRAQAACMLDDQREDCGECTHLDTVVQPDITKVMRGCPIRTHTGYVGVNEQICLRKGCCWNPKDVSFLMHLVKPLTKLSS